jgi:hypothetical protein
VWNAFLMDYFVQILRTAGTVAENFDAGLTGMLFGKGKTYILMLKGGFSADVDDDELTSEEEHPLYKVRSVMQLSAASIQSFGFWVSLGANGVQQRLVY